MESAMAGSWVRIFLAVLGGLAVLVAAFLITLGLLNLWDRQERIVQAIILKNGAHRLEVTRPVSSDPAKARVSDGVALADGSITPQDPNSIIRVHIRTYAWSDRFGTAVVALFRDGQEEPVQVFTKPLPAPKVQEVIALSDMPANVASTLGLHVRVGPADERPVMINGSPGGTGFESIVTIHEIKRSGR
jgi:hypothetical protein